MVNLIYFPAIYSRQSILGNARIHLCALELHGCGNQYAFARVIIQRVTRNSAFLCSFRESNEVHPEMSRPHLKEV
jgi:hypothetical protein